MNHKECPWCKNLISIFHLGKRQINKRVKWYQYSSKVKVCPYCANSVKPGGKTATMFGCLVLPILLLFAIEVLFGIVIANYWYLGEVSWVLAGIGLIGFYWFYEFEKVQDS